MREKADRLKRNNEKTKKKQVRSLVLGLRELKNTSKIEPKGLSYLKEGNQNINTEGDFDDIIDHDMIQTAGYNTES